MDGDRVTGRAWKILGATALTNFVVGLDLSITNVAVPDMQREFADASTADLSWVLTFYLVMYAGLLIVAGRWADRYGRLRVLKIGMTCFFGGAVLAVFAPSLPILIGARGLQGLSAAMMTPASLGLTVTAFPLARRGTAVAIWSSTLALSSVVGPIAGGFLIEVGSWRWAYGLDLPMTIIAFVWGALVLTESDRNPDARTPDLLGSALVAIGTGSLALAIVQGREWGFSSLGVLVLVVVAVGSVAVVVQRIAQHDEPIVPRTLFGVTSFRIATGSLFLFGLGFFPVILAMVLYLTDVAGYSTLQAGLGISLLPVAATISANVSGPMADRFGFRTVAVPGMLLFGAGAGWLCLRASTNPNYLVDVLPGLLLLGSGIGSGPAILAGAGVSEVEAEHFSVASAVTQTARQLAGAIGLALLIAILGDTDSGDASVAAFRRAFVYLGSVAVLASMLATRLPSRPSS